jgi:hypothetical protein
LHGFAVSSLTPISHLLAFAYFFRCLLLIFCL